MSNKNNVKIGAGSGMNKRQLLLIPALVIFAWVLALNRDEVPAHARDPLGC